MPIRNIVFDLGNVIVDLDIQRAEQLFQDLVGVSFVEASNGDLQTFLDFETGKISESVFLNYFIERSVKPDLQTVDIIGAWNAMLIDIPLERLLMMKSLAPYYRTFILSNTNETHIRWVKRYLKEAYDFHDLDQFVHKSYYSHEMGCRKPDGAIYEMLLDKENIDPGQTLFFDDNISNISRAKAFGIKAILVKPEHEIIDLVKKYTGATT